MAGELNGKVTREPIRQFPDDCCRTIRCQPLQHLGKTRALIDGIGTAHRCIIELSDDLRTAHFWRTPQLQRADAYHCPRPPRHSCLRRLAAFAPSASTRNASSRSPPSLRLRWDTEICLARPCTQIARVRKAKQSLWANAVNSRSRAR